MVPPSGSALATASVPRLLARAWLVLDHEGVAKFLAQPVANQSRHHVRGGTWAKGHDDLNGFVGPLLCRRGANGKPQAKCCKREGSHRGSIIPGL
jgi:hypothetical protein